MLKCCRWKDFCKILPADVIQAQKKTGGALASKILHKLPLNVIDKRCFWLAYGNVAGVAGKYNGVHLNFVQEDEFVKFVRCAAYSVNVTGKNECWTS